MSNDKMPTVEEIEAMANRLLTPGLNMASLHAAESMLRTIADHMRKSEPVAWLAVVSDDSNQYGKNAKANAIDGSMYLPLGIHDLYITPLADAEDARRYRWLRENTRDSFDGSPHILSWHTGCNYVYSGEAADKAIDAYMKEDSHDHPTDR